MKHSAITVAVVLIALVYAVSAAERPKSTQPIFGGLSASNLVTTPFVPNTCLQPVVIDSSLCLAGVNQFRNCAVIGAGELQSSYQCVFTGAANTSTLETFNLISQEFRLATRNPSGNTNIRDIRCPMERTSGTWLTGWTLNIKGHWDSTIAESPFGRGFALDSCTVTAQEQTIKPVQGQTFTQQIITSSAWSSRVVSLWSVGLAALVAVVVAML